MLSILVAHSYFLRFDQKQFERAKLYPPLATLQVASTLREAGDQVAVFDAMLAGGIEEYDASVRAVQPQLALFYEDNFNFLSKMCLGKMRRAACDMIASVRPSGSLKKAIHSSVPSACLWIMCGALMNCTPRDRRPSWAAAMSATRR